MGVFEDFEEWIKYQFWYTLEYIKGIFATSLKAITDFVGGILVALKGAFDPVLQFVIDVKNEVLLIVAGIYDWMKSQAEALLELANDVYSAVLAEIRLVYKDIKLFLSGVYEDIITWFSDLGTEVKRYFDLGYETLKLYFSDLWAGVKEFMTYVKESMLQGFKVVIDSTLEKITALFNLVKDSFGNIKEYTIGLWESFKGYMTQIVASFKASLEDLINIVLDFLDKLWKELKAYVDNLGEYTQAQLESFIENAMTAQMNVMKKLASEV